MTKRDFCSDASRAVGEPLAGTAKHPERLLLIRWPKGRWSRNLAIAQDMSPELVDVIEALRADGRRVNLIDRKQEAGGRCRLRLYPEQLGCDVDWAELPGVLQRLRDGDVTGWIALDRPVMLVCTHGQKDRCCALHGFALYQALHEHAPDFEVWESTHLGGCRLSAGALVLPALHKYGRLLPTDAAPLLEAERSGRPWAEKWRGPCDLVPEAQAVAVAAARAGLVDPGLDNPRPGIWRATTLADTRWFATARDQVTRPPTCSDLDLGCSEEAEVYHVREIAGPLVAIS
ncbi:sucrase ferredoxin [Salipiger mangrovisoli]|uniref:Sucrase ferredoxin n=1 Tax=Salipiger mangrovisoli TaxID=2865933 RepID=A0ABR9WY98_9RHOB|nr:sucrase ferredoxin [Salipiger mangrovisoli]